MGTLENTDATADLADELKTAPLKLINATLGQFEVPAQMTEATVMKEVLKELDMDIEVRTLDASARPTPPVPPGWQPRPLPFLEALSIRAGCCRARRGV